MRERGGVLLDWGSLLLWTVSALVSYKDVTGCYHLGKKERKERKKNDTWLEDSLSLSLSDWGLTEGWSALEGSLLYPNPDSRHVGCGGERGVAVL